MPVEVPNHLKSCCLAKWHSGPLEVLTYLRKRANDTSEGDGRGGRCRTSDLPLPKRARYHCATPRPRQSSRSPLTIQKENSMLMETRTAKGTLIFRQRVCPHCLKSGMGRRKLNRFCPQCDEAVHRLCLNDTAPAHEGFASHCETLRSQGIMPGTVFPQLCDLPRTEPQPSGTES